MKIFSAAIIYVLTLCVLLTGCKYDTDVSNPGDYVKIYMPQASEAPARRTFTMADTAQTIIFGAAYGGPNYPSEKINVSFKVDQNLVSEFNAVNGTSYELLPANSYTLEKTSSVIEKGALKSEPLKIKVKTKGFLEAFKQYLLPISIEQLSKEIPLNESLKTSYFLVEAQREGITLKIMSYGIGSGTVDMNAVAEIVNTQNPDFLVIREIDSVTTRSTGRDLPKILSELIAMPNYIFADAQAFQGGKYGAVVYSKFPVEFSKKQQLYANVTEQGPLGILRVKINDQQNLVFAGTHLNATAARRDLQAVELNNIMAAYTDPVIVAGNFNDKPITGPAYVTFASQFNFPCVTCPANFPKTAPATNSDMVMFKPSDRFRTINYSIGPVSTSNHLPIISQLQLFY
jgi:endonuclease/exonuclease/phosphatase family metal-dependent hydrolase